MLFLHFYIGDGYGWSKLITVEIANDTLNNREAAIEIKPIDLLTCHESACARKKSENKHRATSEIVVN